MSAAVPSLFSRLLFITFAGLLGALAGGGASFLLGWSGVAGAVVALLVAMPIASALFAAGVLLLRPRGGR